MKTSELATRFAEICAKVEGADPIDVLMECYDVEISDVDEFKRYAESADIDPVLLAMNLSPVPNEEIVRVAGEALKLAAEAEARRNTPEFRESAENTLFECGMKKLSDLEEDEAFAVTDAVEKEYKKFRLAFGKICYQHNLEPYNAIEDYLVACLIDERSKKERALTLVGADIERIKKMADKGMTPEEIMKEYSDMVDAVKKACE